MKLPNTFSPTLALSYKSPEEKKSDEAPVDGRLSKFSDIALKRKAPYLLKRKEPS